MADHISDSDDSDKFEWDWDNDGEAESSSAPSLRNLDAPGPSRLVRQDANGRATGAQPSDSLVGKFVGMGFTKEMVLKGIKHLSDTCEGTDTNELLSLLLTYKYVGDDASLGNCSTSGCAPQSVEEDDDDDFDIGNWDEEGDAGGRDPNSDGSDDEGFLQEMSQKDDKIKLLVDMGYAEDEADLAISRCGLDAAVSVLVDSIFASRAAGDCYSKNLSDHEVMETYGFNSFGGRAELKRKRKRCGGGAQGSQSSLDGNYDDPMPLPNPMDGFNLPNVRLRSVNRRLPEAAIGPPFFYYENVALAPKGVWAVISRHLYNIVPEFVDSKYMCAAARKRGYIHNLPIDNRFPLLPLPKKTIFGAFPHYEEWWPSWDSRKQLNCLQTCISGSKLIERIRRALASFDDIPSKTVQKYVMEECRKWNLVWIGKNRVAPLEPHEMEYLLGFPKDHTRGVNKTERYKSLGNSFQVDTVAYHLSVLKNMFPNGINVLSLFTGIGGGEVALHKLGIHMKMVLSVEISQVSRNIFRSWWEQTQSGTLIEINDVQSLTAGRIEAFIKKYGGFDLVIGGSPCNNLAGSNRHHRDGLEGEQSSLFYQYVRILDTVKSVMRKM